MGQSSRLVGAGIVFGVAALVSFLYVDFLLAVGIALVVGLLGFLLLRNSKLIAVFTIPELRQKIFITLVFLTNYRIRFSHQLPFVDQKQTAETLGQRAGALAQNRGS